MINIDDFAKVEIKVGEIVSVEKIEESNKLLKLKVDFGEDEPRQVISGISKFFPEIEDLIGRKCSFVTNLEPREILGMESQAMILAFSTDDSFSLMSVDESIPAGTKAK